MPGSFAVIGCGSIGRRHLRNLRALGVDSLIAYDQDATLRGELTEIADTVCTSLSELLAMEPQAVLIATPPASHLPLAQRTIEAGCHTLIEKPLANRTEGIDGLQEQAEGQGVKTTIACNMRFHPGPSTVATWLRAGRIGEPLYGRFYTGSYLPRWRPERDYRRTYSASPAEGGALLDCIHEIDLAQWILGPAMLRTATTKPAQSLGLETEGMAELILSHEGGSLGSVHLNFVQRDYKRSIHLVGSQGSIYWDFNDGDVELYGPDGSLEEIYRQDPAWEPDDMYKAMLERFILTLTDGAEPLNPIQEARQTLEIALEARFGK